MEASLDAPWGALEAGTAIGSPDAQEGVTCYLFMGVNCHFRLRVHYDTSSGYHKCIAKHIRGTQREPKSGPFWPVAAIEEVLTPCGE